MIRLVLVEDSPVQRELLLFLLEEDGGFEIVGIAENGAEAVATVARLRPDVVLMDYHLPKLNGAEATRRIMEETPVPVVITSASMRPDDIAPAFDAVGTGALALLPKPIDIAGPDHARQVAEFLSTLRLMSEVKVVRRRPLRVAGSPLSPATADVPPRYDLVAIGASTGGPAVLSDILARLPADLPAPVIIVQHMARGFAAGFAKWLDGKTGLRVKLGTEHEPLVAGIVYLAPDDTHLCVSHGKRIVLSDAPAENGFRPSVSSMFHSIAKANRGNNIGIILTGMGRDGVAGLKAVRDAGGLTIAQDEKSCVVFGMPREAVLAGAVDQVLTPDGIAAAVTAAVLPNRRASHV